MCPPRMSPILILLVAASFLLLFSQFGSRLAARNSAIWWLVALFLLLATIDPELFRPAASLLGIQLISNFVFAVVFMFLLFQMVENHAERTAVGRKLVSLVASGAVREFVGARGSSPAVPGPRVLVVVPCYNEEASLPALLPQLRALVGHPGPVRFEFCIVNDGSQDGSARLLREQATDSSSHHATNVGVAAVLLTGFRIARELDLDFVVQCDADGQHPVEQIPRLVEVARQSGADLLIGSRFLSAPAEGDSALESTTVLRRIGGLLLSGALRLFGTGAKVTDPTSGFRVYSRRAIQTLVKAMPDEYPEPELIALAALKGLSIQEVPVAMTPRTTGQSSLAGLAGARFMTKVLSALLGLRLRSLVGG